MTPLSETETEFIAKFKKTEKDYIQIDESNELGKGTRRSELISAGPIVRVHKLIFLQIHQNLYLVYKHHINTMQVAIKHRNLKKMTKKQKNLILQFNASP